MRRLEHARVPSGNFFGLNLLAPADSVATWPLLSLAHAWIDEVMIERLEELTGTLREVVAGLDGPALHARTAMRLVELFAGIERLANAGRTISADRVQQTRAWRATGSSSAAAWIAGRTGSTLMAAAASLNTAQNLKRLPKVQDAFVGGLLSHEQAAEISAAAAADPAAEENLLRLAERESFAALRERCRDVRAAASGDEDAYERIRRGRYLRHWNARDGALRLDGRLAPDDAAPLIAAVRARAERLRLEAARAGHPESAEAHAADALVSLVDGAGAPKAVVSVHVSQTALERGHTQAGETCRIDNVGPISVAAAKRFADSGVVKLLEGDGIDVRRVAHPGRTIPARLRSALEARDPTCVVPGCNRRHGLEIDHVTPFALGGRTALENLARLCRWHHAQKTHHGWKLLGRPGAWIWARKPHGERTPVIRGP